MSKANSFEMVDCPVAELDGIVLDYAVAIVEGGHRLRADGFTWRVTINGLSRVLGQGRGTIGYQPGRDWQHGGPIIEQHEITIKHATPTMQESRWQAFPSMSAKGAGGKCGTGPTPLVAAMRCHVASKLGDSVEIPKDLIEWVTKRTQHPTKPYNGPTVG